MESKLAIISVLFVASVLLFGCTNYSQPPAQPPPSSQSNMSPPAQEADAPTFAITSPANGATVLPGDIKVTLTTDYFSEGAMGSANEPNYGHFHLFLDNGSYILCSSLTTCTVPNVTAGKHTIRVEMHNNDHTLYPGVQPLKVTVNIVAPAVNGSTGMKTPPSIVGTKFSEWKYYPMANQIAPGPISAAAQTAMNVFTVNQSQQADGSLRVMVKDNEDKVVSNFTVKTGQTLYFSDGFAGDDVGNESDSTLIDDHFVLVDGNNTIVEALSTP